ncbi:MAG: hypothetical protein ABIV47_20920 [Roseiflexaceae bacterium]
MPDLNLVAIQIGEKDIRLAWAKFTLAQDCPTSTLNGLYRQRDIGWIDQPEAAVRYSTHVACMRRMFVEYKHIAAIGGLRLNDPILPIYHDNSKYILIESKRPLGIANGERNMG